MSERLLCTQVQRVLRQPEVMRDLVHPALQGPHGQMPLFVPVSLVCPLPGKKQNRPLPNEKGKCGCSRNGEAARIVARKALIRGWPIENKFKVGREQENQRVTGNQVHGL